MIEVQKRKAFIFVFFLDMSHYPHLSILWCILTETDIKVFCGVQNPSEANPSKAETAEPTKMEESEPTKMSDSELSVLVNLTFVGLTSGMSGVAEHKSKTLSYVV